MNIGEKIRELRVAKLMTQSELAGTQITRNMLSCIENGTANPSLSTILYIAQRLNVPAGFLLAEEGDELVYRKMSRFSNIKSAYLAKDWLGCRSLCLSLSSQLDDESLLLLADCDLGIAQEEFWNGNLRAYCRFFDETLEYAEKTMYQAPHVEATAQVYFRYMRLISPTLYSDVLDEQKLLAYDCNSTFSGYVRALDALEEGNAEYARAFVESEEESSFTRHLQARLLMEAGEFLAARERLTAMLEDEEPLNQVLLYSVLCGLEICCRETEDFKGAYTYANDKILLLERLLKEI